MKNFMNKLTSTLICTGLGMMVTAGFVWVILLASNFKGF